MEESELLRILYLQNPWWEGKSVQTPETKREEFYTIEKKLEDRLVCAIIGPRRVGKSVIMQQLIHKLLEKGIDSKHILFAQLDEPFFESEKGLLINRIIEAYSNNILRSDLNEIKDKIYIFLDEVQRMDDWSGTLKSFYDRNYNIKFIVSGSSSAGIKIGSSESLAGRISLNTVMTLKFVDFLKFKKIECPDSRQLTEDFKKVLEGGDIRSFFFSLKKNYNAVLSKQQKIESALSEYLIKGGYIELVNQDDYAKCFEYLKDLIQLVIYKDIVKVFKIRSPKTMEELLLYLSNHSSELLSEINLSQNLRMKTDTVSEYLEYLEEVFLVNTSKIYSTNRAKQLRNPRKLFINDSGIRNMLNGTYSLKTLADSKDVGLIAETIVHNHLLGMPFIFDYNSKCYYWKNNFEIDNVIVYGRKPIPFEVKFKNEIRNDDLKGCAEFIKENHSPLGIIITKNKLEMKEKIIQIPLWYFLLIR